MRLFAAIDLPPDLKRRLTDIQSEMKRRGVKGNYTKEENFHVTLAFIGEWSDPEQVIRALDGVLFDKFDFELSGLGRFDGVWWAGVSRSDKLSRLAHDVRGALQKEGIPYDKKRFSPHLTLIRKPFPDELPDIYLPGCKIVVGSFYLMRSDRGAGGVIYTKIAQFKCK